MGMPIPCSWFTKLSSMKFSNCLSSVQAIQRGHSQVLCWYIHMVDDGGASSSFTSSAK